MAQKKAETPWHKDDVLEVTIEDMDQDGNGIGHTEDGYTLFIKDAVIGDKVTAKVMKATPKYAFAKLTGGDHGAVAVPRGAEVRYLQ